MEESHLFNLLTQGGTVTLRIHQGHSQHRCPPILLPLPGVVPVKRDTHSTVLAGNANLASALRLRCQGIRSVYGQHGGVDACVLTILRGFLSGTLSSAAWARGRQRKEGLDKSG